MFSLFNRDRNRNKEQALRSLEASEAVFGKHISNIELKNEKTAYDQIVEQNCIRYIEKNRDIYNFCTGIEHYDCVLRQIINADEFTDIKNYFVNNLHGMHKALKIFVDKSYIYKMIDELENDIKSYASVKEIVVNSLEEFNYLSKDIVMAKYYDDITYRDSLRTKVNNVIDSLHDTDYSNDFGVKLFEQSYCKYRKKTLPKEIRISRILIDCKNTQNNKIGYYSFSNKYIEKWRYKNSVKGAEHISESKIERDKLTPGLRYDILKRDQFKCQICGRSVEDGVKLHVDHIKPISKGGLTVAENLRTLCQDCNLGKSNKYDEDLV